MKKLTTSRVAAMLGVSDQSVANWIDQGQLKAGKTPGGHRRIEKEDLIEFLHRQKLKIPVELSSKKPCILIVDDDQAICDWLKEALSQRFGNCRLISATDGYSAGEIVATEQPSIILLDLYMPDLDGFEVCRRIKNGPLAYSCTVLGMTAHPSRQASEAIVEAGAMDCIEKPIELARLCEIISKHISKSH